MCSWGPFAAQVCASCSNGASAAGCDNSGGQCVGCWLHQPPLHPTGMCSGRDTVGTQGGAQQMVPEPGNIYVT